MDGDREPSEQRGVAPREPFFDLPWPLTAVIAIMGAITALRGLLSPGMDEWMLSAGAGHA